MLAQNILGMINLLITFLGVGAFQLFYYLLPFVLAGAIAFVVYKKKLRKEYYWLAYAAFTALVYYYASYLAFAAKDPIRVWVEVLWFWHAPMIIPALMISPALLLMAFLHSFGYGRWAQERR